ncbi:histone deacetylase 6 isoform X3 [Pristis pectinata]|uniref:histone deacetylase 6 isoform X3 n=1 Tax=Pristis pectinata TaxID=685728 RepID=UPI00223D42E2|nr:histone deacetylase 6 isoform X3 [Pristis pectinata]
MEVPPNQARQQAGAGGGAPRAAARTAKSEKKGKKPWLTRKQVKMSQNQEDDEIVSQLTDLHLGEDRVVQGTALSYDDRLTEPRCSWDSRFPERPERVTAVMQKIREYGLMERCTVVEAREATKEELLLVHSSDYIEQIKATENMSTDELQSLASTYDRVFLHEKIYPACCLAVGCVLQVVDQVMEEQVRNGLAVVRPPGHNALSNMANGYCIFNNLAIAAKYAQQKHRVGRVLIVDWDIHHGQGTQYIFEDDPSVLYFSIHRYEHGDFWPHLPESDCTSVGGALGRGYNVNIPWNKTGMSDADYITAFHNVLMPLAHEFRPHLVLVAAGFSSAVGDPQGNMLASPACFAHLTYMLLPLATGKLILSLEGGYNLQATAEATCACLKVLLGDPCPKLELPYLPKQSALESISAVIAVHRKYWKSLQNRETGIVRENPPAQHHRHLAFNLEQILNRSMQEVMRPLPPHRTGLVYDEQMKEHHNMWDLEHPEQPQRISQIFARHQELHLVERCVPIPAKLASEADLQLCHDPEYIDVLKATRTSKPRELHRLSSEYNSIYISNKSYDSALMAVGSTFNVVEAVVQNGVAIVRPPGHHAESDYACGFCFFNNVALAARYAQKLAGQDLRVLILDWDVHHGNGTQHMFEDDPSILYISLHRHDHGMFFPNSEDADYDRVGRGSGEGFNVNIPWNGSRMGDPEYMAAFQCIIMPISYQFQPELVLISAGFDAARGDPLGGCQVTPECYAHMTHMLQSLAGGRVVMVLEGGYNLTSISESMSMCTRTLLGDTPPYLEPLAVPLPSALETIGNVIAAQRNYWSCLRLLIPDLEPQNQASMTRRASVWGQQQLSQAESPSYSSARRGSFWGQPDNSSQAKPSSYSSVRRGSVWGQPDNSSQVTLSTVRGDTSGHQVPTDTSPDSVSRVESVAGSSQSRKQSTETQQSTLTQEPDWGSDSLPKRRVSLWPQVQPPSHLLNLDSEGRPLRSRRGSLWPQLPSLETDEQSPLDIRPPLWSGRESSPPPPTFTTSAERDPSRSSEARLPSQGARQKDPLKMAKARISDQQDLDLTSSSSSKGQSESEEEAARGKGRCPDPPEPLYELTAGPGMVYAVTPLTSCPQLRAVMPVPDSGLDVWQPCDECGAEGENWVCLSCYKVYCGRYVNAHMENHWQITGHPLVLSYADLSAWCYGCDAYIHHEMLLPAKEEAHRLKFGQGLVG